MWLLLLGQAILRIRICFLFQFYLYFLCVLVGLIVGSLHGISIHLFLLLLLLEVGAESLVFPLLFEIDCI